MSGTKKSRGDNDVDVRFLLANERTLLAWVRTGLAIIAGGVAVAFLSAQSTFATIAGMGAVLFGALVSLVGYHRYRMADQAIRVGELPKPGIGSLFVVIGVTCFALCLVVLRDFAR